MDDREWLEPDGLGGFASGTASGIRSRRYHALLLAARTPPTGRFVLVNGLDAEAVTAAGRFALSSQRYTPDVVSPDGFRRIADFQTEPWPTWRFRLEDGTEISQELFAVHGSPQVVVRWVLVKSSQDAVELQVRLFLSGRDYHALHHENPAFRFDAEVSGESVRFEPYPGVPAVTVLSNGRYEAQPSWYRSFLYERERERGLDFVEDLAAPGVLRFDLYDHPAVMILAAGGAEASLPGSTEVAVEDLIAAERRRRRRFASRLGQRAADGYLVQRGSGQTLVAGYPWFTDWGRDTFIALRGLCLALGRFVEARAILLEWAGAVSEGMLPNRFPDQGESPEYNSVDAALWFVVAVHDLWSAPGDTLSDGDRARLGEAVEAILEGYAKGTRHGIGLDHDGLLAAGEPGIQLTWMDAKVDDWVVTPRIGKPVEVQALWLNALAIGARLANSTGRTSGARWSTLFDRGTRAFLDRFWNDERGCLFDVVDCDHRSGQNDPSFRPNQILPVGGLPFPVLEGLRARQVVDAVEARLLTPVGLRSLAPGEPGYAGHYQGGPRERDGAYHQGTVWPWLMGPFVEAWLRVRGGTAEAKQEARTRFLAPLQKAAEAGGGHLFEIADGDLPHLPRGCPFQAWSVGEMLRIEAMVGEKSTTPS
jgi:predicted glycogen debranching enzyme